MKAENLTYLKNGNFVEDIEMVSEWLRNYRDSENTFESYRKEVSRYLLWLSSNQLRLKDIRPEHVHAYNEFMRNPSDDWLSEAKVSAENPEWRPFNKPLSESSARLANTIIKGMLNWMVASRYLDHNPMSLVKMKAAKKGNAKLERFLTDEQVAFVLKHIEGEETDNRWEMEIKARNRWIFCALYYSMMRISELARAMLSDIDHTTIEGRRAYWIKVISKGGYEDEIAIPDAMMDELRAYHKRIGITSGIQAALPLILRTGSRNKSMPMTRAGLHLAFKKILEGAALEMLKNGREIDASIFRKSSAHWLRHTAGSSLARNGANIVQVRDSMRHRNVTTTSLYMHNERSELHKLINDIHRIPESK